MGLIIRLVLLVITLMVTAHPSMAQNISFIARTGFDTSSNQTYNLVQVFVTKERAEPITVGFISFSDGRTGEIFAGAGYTVFDRKHFHVFLEGDINKEIGTQREGGLYFQPFIEVGGSISSKISYEAAGLLYLPLNEAGTYQAVLERVKVSYAGRYGAIGGGLGGYKFGSSGFEYQPFISYTPPGDKWRFVEFWYQVATGAERKHTFQIRFSGKLK